MFLAAKYARKKYKERQQRNVEGATELEQRLPPESHGMPVNGVEPPTADGNHPQSPAARPNTIQDYARLDDPVLSKSDVAKPHGSSHDDDTTAAEKRRRRVYRYKIIFGLFMPFTLQALDTTIIASALPFIAGDFGAPLSSRTLFSLSPVLTAWMQDKSAS